MDQSVFVGRTQELELLEDIYKRKKPNLVVIKGRRRIGKSRLILEFSKKLGVQRFWSFAGLAPQEGVSAQSQRDNFAKTMAFNAMLPPMTFVDWSDAFEHLSLHLKEADIILFDEISWMAAKDPTFIPKLKAWWDKQTKHMMLVFCGSVSTWIEDNILNNTAFFGRVNLTLSLQPLSIPESAEFLKKQGVKTSSFETFKLLSVLGGVPWYLEQVSNSITADENLHRLCFKKNGLLVSEFDKIFHDLFNKKGSVYKKILETLKEGPKTLAEIRQVIDFPQSGTLSQMMNHLMVAGFIEKQSLWSFKTTKLLKQSLYRIIDPYIRFYLKMIAPSIEAIKLGDFDLIPISTIPGFDVHLGLQIECLLLQNRCLILQKLGISPVDIVRSGSYRQFRTNTQEGCQIDCLIQTKTNTLFVCEFKFKKREINSDIIVQMQEKLKRLKAPRGFAKVPVLFHLSGVADSVETSSFFYRIIDVSDFLKTNESD